MKFNLSFWERESFLRNPDVVILGGGIVGVNAAITLKQNNPKLDVLILERGNVPIGASTRNAGFACFGSVTELLDDLEDDTEENVFTLLNERFKGLQFMTKRLSKSAIEYLACGSYEVFDQERDLTDIAAKIPWINEKIAAYSGLKKTFDLQKIDGGFPGLNKQVIFNRHEGSLHPGKMMLSFYHLANHLGVRFLGGINIDTIEKETDNVVVSNDKYTFTSKSCIICTNGFVNGLYDLNLRIEEEGRLDVKPVRNQVLLTERIDGLNIKSCYHYDKGYVYFRNVGNRLLIGGGRNISLIEEETSDFGATKKIKDYLSEILYQKIGISKDTKIEHSWSGILGVGSVKTPILRKVTEGIIFAVRLGGMGVALGSRLGDQAAKLLLKNE